MGNFYNFFFYLTQSWRCSVNIQYLMLKSSTIQVNILFTKTHNEYSKERYIKKENPGFITYAVCCLTQGCLNCCQSSNCVNFMWLTAGRRTDLGRDSVYWCPVSYEGGVDTSSWTAHCVFLSSKNYIHTWALLHLTCLWLLGMLEFVF